MKYTLASFTVKQEQLKPAKRALAELVAAIREHEPRTLFLVFREDSSATFFTVMSFENEAAERRHSQSRYVAQFARKLLPWCEGKPRFTEMSFFAGSRKQWLMERDAMPAPQLLAMVAAHSRHGNGAPSRLLGKGRVGAR